MTKTTTTPTTVLKATGIAARASKLASSRESVGPELQRTEPLDRGTRERFGSEIETALKRHRPSESNLAGALRAVAPLSPMLQSRLATAACGLGKRRAFGRELYGVALLAATNHPELVRVVESALLEEDGGHRAHLLAASAISSPRLTLPLKRLAAQRQAFVAFTAEYARLCRGESSGERLAVLAPMIKETHRVALVNDLFVPLARSGVRPSAALVPALAVFRAAERHLGRWLPLAELGRRAGDERLLVEVQARTKTGPAATRLAWTYLAWALEGKDQASRLAGLRPTLDQMARLSDRPSAERDMTFLFRLASAGVPTVKPILESFASGELDSEVAIRSARALSLAFVDAGSVALADRLHHAAKSGRPENLRGLAVASMWDIGQATSDKVLCERARDEACNLMVSRDLSNVAWSALVRCANQRGDITPVVTDAHVRWLGWGHYV